MLSFVAGENNSNLSQKIISFNSSTKQNNEKNGNNSNENNNEHDKNVRLIRFTIRI